MLPRPDFVDAGALLEPAFAKLRAEAAAWHAARTAFLMARLKQGRHPDIDTDFWLGYQETSPPRLPSQSVPAAYAAELKSRETAGPLRRHRRAGGADRVSWGSRGRPPAEFRPEGAIRCRRMSANGEAEAAAMPAGFGMATTTFVVVSSMVGAGVLTTSGYTVKAVGSNEADALAVGRGRGGRPVRGVEPGRGLGGLAGDGGRLRLPVRGVWPPGGLPVGLGLVPDRLRRADRRDLARLGQVSDDAVGAGRIDGEARPAGAGHGGDPAPGGGPQLGARADDPRAGGDHAPENRRAGRPDGRRPGRRVGSPGQPDRPPADRLGDGEGDGLLVGVYLICLHRLERGGLPGGRGRRPRPPPASRDAPGHGRGGRPVPGIERGLRPGPAGGGSRADRRRPGRSPRSRAAACSAIGWRGRSRWRWA